jgi:hypothetical protein
VRPHTGTGRELSAQPTRGRRVVGIHRLPDPG